MRKHMKLNLLLTKKLFTIISGLALLFAFIPATYAAPLTAVSATPTRIVASTAASHVFKYTTPTGVGAGQYMRITFPAGFTIGSVAFGDIDVSWGPSTGLENNLTLAAVPATTTWGAAFTGQALSITSATGTITAGSKVVVTIGTNATGGVNQITNPTAGTYVISMDGTFGDTGSVAIPIIAADQVTLSASVDASMTFSLSGTTSAFGTLSTGSVTTSASDITLTIGTNTNGGYTVYVKDQGNGTTGGLYNAGQSYNLASTTSTPLVAGTEGYGISATQTGGATITAPYVSSGNNVGLLQRVGQSLATYGTFTSSNHSIVVSHKAAISASTRPGSYTDTITYVATGNY
jgi:hypothetical protein